MTGFIETEYYPNGRGYRVEHAGDVLVEFCKDPFYGAAKALLELGVDVDSTLVSINGTLKMRCMSGRLGFVASLADSHTPKDD